MVPRGKERPTQSLFSHRSRYNTTPSLGVHGERVGMWPRAETPATIRAKNNIHQRDILMGCKIILVILIIVKFQILCNIKSGLSIKTRHVVLNPHNVNALDGGVADVKKAV